MEQYVMKDQKKLRCGITTGTCASAAAKAAAAFLLLGIKKTEEMIHTPKGVTVQVPVFLKEHGENYAVCYVIKDSGDDPDVTNQAEIYVRVERWLDAGRQKADAFFSDQYPNLILDGGQGVGRVAREGLEQRVGQAAINTVPRSMVFDAVHEICELAEYRNKLLITIFVPAGEELAKKTFNPRLGIEGGISILGTSGILEPMSEKAIVDTIETEIRQQSCIGKENLLVMPGNYGQSYASEYLKLSLEGSVKCSNYIGETIDLAVSYGMKRFLLVGNIGKLVKLAAGIMNTHSKVADGRSEIFAVHAVLCGGDQKLVQEIMACINTEQMLALLEEQGIRQAVCDSICQRIEEYMGHRIGEAMQYGVILFSEHFGWLGQTEGAEEILAKLRMQQEKESNQRR